MVQVDNMLIRSQLIKTWDDKQPQGLEVWGRHNERMGGTTGEHALPRVQYYGFTSHAPVGSQGLILCLNGNPDVSVVVGMEHPDHRPKNLAEGEFKLYDKWGHQLYAQETQWKATVGSAVILMTHAGVVHLNPP